MVPLLDFVFLTAGLVTIYLGIMVTVRGSHRPIHTTFTFFAVTLGLWLVSLALLGQTQDPLFEKFSVLFAVLGIMSLPVFLYAFPRNSWPPRLWFWLLYIPAIPLVILSPTKLFVGSLTFDNGIIIPVLGPWFQPLAVILIAYLLLTLVIYLIRFYTNKGNDRIRLQYIGAGLIVMLFISAVGGVILPFFDNYDYFLTAPVSALLVFVTLATLAVIQHDLIDVRIIITEVFVFLAAGLVLVNNLVNSDNHLQLITTSFILAMFLFTAFRLTTMILNILKQRRALNSANVKMKELMDMKTEFLQIASHQLRAPLTSLHGLVQMEATGYFDDLSVNKRDEFRKQMLSSVDRLHELVNDLLKTLRLEGEKIPLKFATMDLTKVISDAIVTLKPNYEKRGLYVKFEEPKNKIIAIEGDIEYLRQVFVNIIDNAERYTTKGGITVSIKEGNGTVEVSVQDTGIGISPEEQGLLFQKFSRGCRAQQLRNEGTGLGLFIARKIVEEHHGLLLLTSPGIDKGTTATVKLPVKQPQASAAKNDPEPQTSDEPSK